MAYLVLKFAFTILQSFSSDTLVENRLKVLTFEKTALLSLAKTISLKNALPKILNQVFKTNHIQFQICKRT